MATVTDSDPYEYVEPSERGLCVKDGGPALGGKCLLHGVFFLDCTQPPAAQPPGPQRKERDEQRS